MSSTAEFLKEVKRGNVTKVNGLLGGTASRDSIDINGKEVKSGNTALHTSIENADVDIINILLRDHCKTNPLDLNVQNGNSHTPLSLACAVGSTDCLEALLNRKDLDVNYTIDASDGMTATHFACSSECPLDIIKNLHRRGADLNAKSASRSTPLFAAVNNRDSEKALWLMQNEKVDLFSSINLKDSTTFLHVAVVLGLGDIVNEFLTIVGVRLAEGKLDKQRLHEFINQKNKKGNTILHEAAINKRMSLMKLLATKGVSETGLEQDARNSQNQTAEDIVAAEDARKRLEDEQKISKQNEAKVEKAAQKEERRRRDKQEKEDEAKQEEIVEQQRQIEAVNTKSNNVRSLVIFFLALLMIAFGIVLFFKAKRNMEIKNSFVAPQRTDYDDFL